jgi:hypothetical protein
VNSTISKKLHKDGKEWKHEVRNEPVVNEEQNGLRRGRSKWRACLQFNSSWGDIETVLFIDPAKAIDSVS